MINFTTKKDGAQVVNTYINGTKSAIQLEGCSMYLMSHCKAWDGSHPQAMHGWKFGAIICPANDNITPDEIKKDIQDVMGWEVKEITFEGEDLYNTYRANITTRTKKTAEPEPVATAEPEPVATAEPEPVATAEPKPVATAEPEPVATGNVPTMDAASAALAGLFGGVATNVTNNVMAKVKAMVQPIIDRAPVVHVFQLVDLTGAKKGKVTGITHKCLDAVVSLLSSGENVYLYGPAGSGKSEIARQAAELMGLHFYMDSSLTQTFDLSGFKDANSHYNETPFYKAFKFGGLWLYDEADGGNPEVLLKLNQALANGYYSFAGEIVKAHPDFHMIATGNTTMHGATSEYNTRYQMDGSSIDRLWPMFVDYDPRVEEACANNDKEILTFVRDLRKSAKDAGISMILGYRCISKLAKTNTDAAWKLLTGAGILQGAVLKGMEKDEIGILANGLKHKDNKFAKAMIEMAA